MPSEAPGRWIVVVPGLALALGGCGNLYDRPPSSPTSAFRLDIVGVAEQVVAQSCGVTRVVLASGDHVDLVMAGSSLNYQTPCPSGAVEASRRLFGTNEAEADKDHLFLAGRDADGRSWYGWAHRTAETATSVGTCDPRTYAIPGGAFEAGGAFHLPSGLVLATSPSFDRGASDAPAASGASAASGNPTVVRQAEWICVDPHGAVVSVGRPSYP